MHKTRWTPRILAAAVVSVSVILSVWAQTMNEDSAIVSEDMSIDDALNTDLNAKTSGVSTDQPAVVTEAAPDLALPEPSTPAATDNMGGLDVSPEAVEAPVATLPEGAATEALEVAPAIEAVAAAPEAVEPSPEPALEGADGLATLEFDQEKGGAVAPDTAEASAVEEPAATPVQSTQVAPDGMESPIEAIEAPVPTAAPVEDIAAEPVAVEVAPTLEPVQETVPAAEAVEAAVTPEVAEAVPARATRRVSEKDKAISVLREGEELRRRAFAEHAAEKLALADTAFKNKNFIDSQRFYEQAANALEQAGGRPENRTELKRARDGALESMYQRAVQLNRDGDYENARKLASEAAVQGHPRAAALVERIDKNKQKPAPAPKGEPSRWKQEDYLQKKGAVETKLRKGREHYYANELDAAQEQFEAVLDQDSHNTEAIRWREKVTQTRYDRASAELETTRVDMMSQVREAWNPRDYGAGEIPKPPTTTTANPVQEFSQAQQILGKMEGIIIPEVDFRQANVNDVVQFLQEASVEYDRSSDGKKGVNFILKLNAGEAAPVSEPAANAWGGGGAEPEVGGTSTGQDITFRAREISLLEALKIVTDVAGLKYRVQGNVVMIVPFNTPDTEIIHRMYDVLPTVGERINTIRNSAGATVAGDRGEFTALGGAGVGGDSAGTDWKAFFTELGVQWPIGSQIKYVPAIGKLMVANTAENLAVFEQRLAALNIVPKQIEIEARFVEVNQTDLSSLGFEWLLTDDWEIAAKKSSTGLPLSQQQRISMSQSDLTAGNRYVTDNAGKSDVPEDLASAKDGLVQISSLLTNPELSFILHALEQKGHADLLSAPKVTTQSGREAQIKVVTEYIYPSDYTIEPGVSPTLNADGSIQSAGTPPVVTPAEFQTREVGVILTVLPEVSTEGQMINLTMSPEVVTDPTWRNYGQTYTDAAGNILQIPIEQPFFHSRSIQTSILIYNGATVVMGGMITEDRQQVEDKIPFLGDIPVLGRLFQSKYDRSVKRNLLIFVTARLVDPAGRQVGGSVQEPMTATTATPAP